MGLIILDANGNYDQEASLRANRAHNKMMEIGLAEQRGEPIDKKAAAEAMGEVLGAILPGNNLAVERVVHEARIAGLASGDGGSRDVDSAAITALLGIA